MIDAHDASAAECADTRTAALDRSRIRADHVRVR